MDYIQLPHTDLNVFPVCMGTAYFGTKVSQKVSYKILDAYFAYKGNLIDTAIGYADWIWGNSESEKVIGAYLQTNNYRKNVVISTKGANEISKGNVDIRQIIKEDIGKSLDNLRTDYIDIYFIHKDFIQFEIEAYVDVLMELKNSGLIKHFGFSNWSYPRYISAFSYALAKYNYTVPFNQVLWNIAQVNSDFLDPAQIVVMNEKFKKFHIRNNTSALAFSSNAGGFFYREELQASNDVVSKTYYNKQTLMIFEYVKSLQKKYDVGIESIVLGYLLSQKVLTVPIIGCSTVQQIQNNLSENPVRLNMKELEKIERIKSPNHFNILRKWAHL